LGEQRWDVFGWITVVKDILLVRSVGKTVDLTAGGKFVNSDDLVAVCV
jgi:hypothetical protein